MTNASIWLFALCATLIAYVLIGYPLLLAFLTRNAHQPLIKRWQPRTVSIVLPVYNGARWIRTKLDSILALDYPPDLLQTIVIDDGSTDGTGAIVSEYVSRGIECVRIPRSGKPTALNTGIVGSRGELLFLTDVRQVLDPGSLRHLVACFADPLVGVASGELVILDGNTRQEANIGLYWRYEKWIRDHQSRLDSMLGATGCIYAIRRELTVPIPAHMLLDDVYLPLSAFFKGYRLVVDSAAKAFDYPTALRSEFGRKLRTQAGVYQVTRAYPRLFLPRTRMWVHYASHKLGRLALPHLLILMALATVGLPQSWRTAAIIAQATFYALACADVWIPASWPIKRLSSLCRTVVVLLAAALFAIRFVVTGTSRLWKETEVQQPLKAQTIAGANVRWDE